MRADARILRYAKGAAGIPAQTHPLGARCTVQWLPTQFGRVELAEGCVHERAMETTHGHGGQQLSTDPLQSVVTSASIHQGVDAIRTRKGLYQG